MTRNKMMKNMVANMLAHSDKRDTLAYKHLAKKLAETAAASIEARGYDFFILLNEVETAAKSNKPITYGDLELKASGRVIGKNTGDAQIGQALGELTAYFFANRIPALNVFVVNKSGQAGAGFEKAARMIGRTETDLNKLIQAEHDAVDLYFDRD